MKKNVLAAIIAVIATVATGCTTSVTHGKPVSHSPSSSSSSNASTSVSPSVADVPSEPPSPAYVTPDKTNFTVTLKILTKDCFGSAGCNVTYQPKLAINLPSGSLDPSITYDVTYSVRGADDGAHMDTIQVTGDEYDQPSPNVVSTASTTVKLTAAVTDVEPD